MASAFSIEAEDTYHFEPTGVGIRKLLSELDDRITLCRTRAPAALFGMESTEAGERPGL